MKNFRQILLVLIVILVAGEIRLVLHVGASSPAQG